MKNAFLAPLLSFAALAAHASARCLVDSGGPASPANYTFHGSFVASDGGRGAPAEIAATGSASVAANDLTLHAAHLNPLGACVFLVGSSEGLVIGPGGAQGNLCVAGSMGRFLQQVTLADSFGYTNIDVDLTALPLASGFVAVSPGESWSFQAWYRDLNPGPTSNDTDAVTVTFQ